MDTHKQNGGTVLPVVVVVIVQMVFAVMNILMQQVLQEGLSPFVLITYRQFVATVFIGPIACLKERHKRPKLTPNILLLFFLSALIGMTCTQYFFLVGLQQTSATFASAFTNMVPVFTFLTALPFGIETLNVKSKSGVLKLAGTLFCLGGAMVLTLYKGKTLTHSSVFHLVDAPKKVAASNYELHKNWLIGSLSLLAGCLGLSSWFIVQARIAKLSTALYFNNAVVSLLSCLQAAVCTLIVHRDHSMWLLRGKLQIVTVIYGGAVCSGISYIMMAWCVEKSGPVFTAAFSPLIQVIVAIIEVLFLQEQLHLGSVLGSVIIVIGLYMLLSGKSKELECGGVPKQIQAVDPNTAV